MMEKKKKLKISIFYLKQMVGIDLASKEKETEMVKWRVLRAICPLYIYIYICLFVTWSIVIPRGMYQLVVSNSAYQRKGNIQLLKIDSIKISKRSYC